MSVGVLTFRSAVLNRPQSFSFVLPDPAAAGPGPYPVFYLLHGYSDDHQTWLLNTRLTQYVAGLPLIVVMPDGEHSFYTDTPGGDAHERCLMEELRGIVETCFAARKRGKARCIGGLSMGGFGAMKLGLKYPELFTSVGAHSSAMEVGRHLPDWPVMREELLRIFGPVRPGNRHRWENDLFTLARKLDPAQAPALYFDCGTEDGLLEGNRTLAKLFARRGLPHEYREFPGEHNWEYWDLHVQDSLAFHCRALGIKTG